MNPQTTWALGETVEADALADLHPDTRLVQSVNGFPAGAPRTVRDLSRSSWRHSAQFVIVYLPPRGQPPADHASELLALAAAAANLTVHLSLVGDTDERRRFYHVARVDALRDIEIRLRELAADPTGDTAADPDGCDYPGHPDADRMIAIAQDIDVTKVDRTGGVYDQVRALLAERDHRNQLAAAAAMGLRGDWGMDSVEEALGDAFAAYREVFSTGQPVRDSQDGEPS